MRGDLEHALRSLHFCETPADALAIDDEAATPGVIMPFVDVRRGYREQGRDDVWSNLFHTQRVYVFGQRVWRSYTLFSTSVAVHPNTCTFVRPEPRRRPRRWRRREASGADRAYWHAALARDPSRRREYELWEEAIAADLAYWDEGNGHDDVLRRAAHVLGFGWAAIDYATLADGNAVLWEANPFPHIRGPSGFVLPVERRLSEREPVVRHSYSQFFRDLL